MKFKYVFFGLLTVGSMASFAGCNDSTPEPEEKQDCVTCDNETVTNTLTDIEGVVKRYSTGNPNAEPLYIITTQKRYLETNDNSYGNDSLFVPCPPLSEEFQEIGKKVTISGDVKSCIGVLIDISTNPQTYYGTKLDLRKITERQ